MKRATFVRESFVSSHRIDEQRVGQAKLVIDNAVETIPSEGNTGKAVLQPTTSISVHGLRMAVSVLSVAAGRRQAHVDHAQFQR